MATGPPSSIIWPPSSIPRRRNHTSAMPNAAPGPTEGSCGGSVHEPRRVSQHPSVLE